MRAIGASLFKIMFAIVLLAIAFWPGWGLAYMAVANAAAHPYIVTIGIAIWTMLLGLNLPLSRQQFQYLGAVCFLVILATVLFVLSDKDFFDPRNKDQWIITAIIGGGILLGWLTISSHIWRAYRGVYGVDDADTGGPEE